MGTFLDIALDDELRTSFQVIDRNNDPEAQRQILGSPYTVIGTTDGGARPDKGDRTDYSTRLLSYWVREKQVMSLEDAVHRMTGKTALMHDLHDRGFLAAGKAADITIFDPDTIGPKPLSAKLAQAHRIIAYDRRFGAQSNSPLVVQTWDMVCQDVLDLMDALGIEQASLGGGSFGAAIALGCAVRSPERVRAMVPSNLA